MKPFGIYPMRSPSNEFWTLVVATPDHCHSCILRVNCRTTREPQFLRFVVDGLLSTGVSFPKLGLYLSQVFC